MKKEIKIAIIGLDTSHTNEFTKIIQGKDKKINGLKVVTAFRSPSSFQSEDGQDERQAELEDLGVIMKPTIEEAVKDVDAILIELNDPKPHLEYFKKVADLGLPIFLDKPLAINLKEGKEIIEIAKACGTNMWGASSLRFISQLQSAIKEVSNPTFCNVFGALGTAPAGSSLIWYGCHATEMLVSIMGTNAKKVTAIEDPSGIVYTVEYADNRRGVVQCNRGNYQYGGCVQNSDKLQFFTLGEDIMYYKLLLQIQQFLETGKPPVSFDEMLEVQAVMDAAERSMISGKSETVNN
jgi:predicted dehydrogenase